ncbi:MAG TPA: hypothetical protein VGO91_14480 [Pyrinomonadaceae bacterium]|jgi:hypothetical protein|nr:hypothetical protein [Pyrinomonadaceae bacterium]
MMVGSMLISGPVADAYGLKPVALAGGLVVILPGLLWFLLRRREGGATRERSAANA